jgi:YD repeat-containing protein
MKKLKKLGLLAFIISLVFICNPRQIAQAKPIGNTGQVELMEYVYDANNRLVEIKKAGVTIATLTYDKNGNLVNIQIVS